MLASPWHPQGFSCSLETASRWLSASIHSSGIISRGATSEKLQTKSSDMAEICCSSGWAWTFPNWPQPANIKTKVCSVDVEVFALINTFWSLFMRKLSKIMSSSARGSWRKIHYTKWCLLMLNLLHDIAKRSEAKGETFFLFTLSLAGFHRLSLWSASHNQLARPIYIENAKKKRKNCCCDVTCVTEPQLEAWISQFLASEYL